MHTRTLGNRKVTVQVGVPKHIMMHNSLSVPPKDQGDTNIPPGTGQSGKSLQSKSQFRTIAPKFAPRVLTSRVLPCQSPSLSDQGALRPSMSPKPLGMPTQNYALMQVAGQEGTFSLVALPPVASAQPIQKPQMPENLKLPIPRYQPLRSNKRPRKKPELSSTENGCSTPPTYTQMSSSPPAHPGLPQKPSPCKQMPSPGHALAGASGRGDLIPPVTTSCSNPNPPASSALPTPVGPSARQTLSDSSGRANHTSKKVPSEPSAAARGKLKEQTDCAKATASLSPAICTSSAVQLISSVPRGKLAILPYTRVQTSEVYKTEPDAITADFSLTGYTADCDKRSSLIESFNAALRMASKTPVPPVPKQSLCGSAFCPVAKPDFNQKTKLNIGAAKRRGRKRKVPDEILAFQGKRRKCVINKSRDGKERAKNNLQESKDQKPGALKKYRNIMPKPVTVMSALPPLASAATLQSQTPSSLGQDILLHNAVASKCLSCKQNDSPSPKPSSVFRNGFCGIKKPSHRCQVCNHHFQFKQHLRDHMNTHTNRRPYSCCVCRKAYVRSGSLSAHMKLHHAESRLKKLVCCEFCAKVFGHVRVYFGHLKEVHRVVISTEPTPSAPQPGAMPKSRDRDSTEQEPQGLERENKSSLEEDFLLNQVDGVKLQIKCGRCQITAQSFAEIKFHLLYAHGEEIQGRLQEGILPGHRGAQEALAKHTAPDWEQHPERTKQVKPCDSEDDSRALPKRKRQLCPHGENGSETLQENAGGRLGTTELREAPQGPESPSHSTVFLWSHSGFSCLLCAQTLGKKEELLLHWERRHNCEDPSRLWAVLSALSNQGVVEISRATGK
ncbi:zinc finger protein 438 isoform X2 [Heterocephalus glaber]|uniref:Zinc finger protein 438 isoform X2 n=1 Tax=Heterocephalus glaber TaxID=10181 RepID=A0AAX6RPH4_HETGA|nr:zinc finger protein 438 isoform X2 [Heterocephalus glaber]XP_021097625.1 zinc finger protein 438 isoform X2 [Heterocephalus glaber]XP_021097627.1 zinc finger protein 438 isoform X2 [Heterocephalus glaber]XP_021097628.1 zinc finger protein 438 isoform X2 [Heterocephalus glaber]XP_021097629.1 zinc finger protein 438 isoform X2 [Heterocephalus glaber]XP_021097630.1 zinc finger protein 438 isoform X2 [Heterocephalus glaber]XP_021097631.1 zinc finger protein 438 isoform X2 [Heterocephalus glabe